jgi:hypothetical protein
MRTISALTIAVLTCGTLFGATVIAVQSGGITLNSTNTGTVGSAADPWLIDEDMTASGTLVFRADPPSDGAVGPGNTSGSFHTTGKWIRKTILNDTLTVWTSFELELQEVLGTPSGPGDGLSFADDDPLRLTFSSDQFATYTRIDTTRDYLNFHAGTVNPGESVTFNFIITDNSPISPIYLLQTPNIVDIPEPSTMLLLGAGLITAVGLGRRRRA